MCVGSTEAGAWVLLAPHLLPAEWQQRAISVAGVWLEPAELAALAKPSFRGLTPEQSALLPFILAGTSYRSIATELHVSMRTVQRRMNELCRRFGVSTREQLVLALARREPTSSGAPAPNLSQDHEAPSAKQGAKVPRRPGGSP